MSKTTDGVQIASDVHQVADTENVDWRALFEEFNMHTPDAVGRLAVPETKLAEAVRVSEQNIVGDAREHIQRAYEGGQLAAEKASEYRGGEVIIGYHLGGDV